MPKTLGNHAKKMLLTYHQVLLSYFKNAEQNELRLIMHREFLFSPCKTKLQYNLAGICSASSNDLFSVGLRC